MNKVRVCLLFVTICLGACSGKTDLEGFDETGWQSDPNGCQGLRKEAAAGIPGIKDELMGMGQKEIKRVLGAPDMHELSRRNRKYFIYFVEPGPDCEGPKHSSPRSLWVGFDALGRTNEVIFQNN